MGRTSSASSTESAQKNTDISPISTFGAASGKSQRGTPLCVRSWPSRWAPSPGPDALRKNRIYKYAAALEYFFRKEVLPDDVPRLLKEGGGIDAIYVEACRDAKRSEDQGDDLGETAGELRLACTGDGTDTNPRAAQSGDGDLPSADGRQLAIQGGGTSRQALFFSKRSRHPDRRTPTGKTRPLNRIDLGQPLPSKSSPHDWTRLCTQNA